MSKFIPAAERIEKAHRLLEKARNIPRPETAMFVDFTYAAKVKEVLAQANDLIKFIRYTPAASEDVKRQVAEIVAEMEQLEKDLLKAKRPEGA